MWWTYVKAFWRAANSICGGAIQFKTTIKGASALMNTALRDLAMPIVAFGLLASAIIAGCIKVFSVSTPLFWAVPRMTAHAGTRRRASGTPATARPHSVLGRQVSAGPAQEAHAAASSVVQWPCSSAAASFAQLQPV